MTSQAQSLSDLIERLEKARGENRKIDSAIADLVVGPDRHAFGGDARYTSSIDAALTLVPEGYAFTLRRNCSSDGEVIYCNAQVWRFCDPRDDETPTFWANTSENLPALALCIAALRARAALTKEGGAG